MADFVQLMDEINQNLEIIDQNLDNSQPIIAQIYPDFGTLRPTSGQNLTEWVKSGF